MQQRTPLLKGLPNDEPSAVPPPSICAAKLLNRSERGHTVNRVAHPRVRLVQCLRPVVTGQCGTPPSHAHPYPGPWANVNQRLWRDEVPLDRRYSHPYRPGPNIPTLSRNVARDSGSITFREVYFFLYQRK